MTAKEGGESGRASYGPQQGKGAHGRMGKGRIEGQAGVEWGRNAGMEEKQFQNDGVWKRMIVKREMGY